MEMFFLIIKLSGAYGYVVMPEKYTKEDCAKASVNGLYTGYCIPAPNMCVGGPEIGMVKGTKYPCP